MSEMSIAPAAKSGLNPHHYNPYTIASLDFGEFLVSRRIECEKSDEWNHVHGEGFLRLAALDFPAYGRAFIKSAAFFVPYYQLLENIDGFRGDQLADKGIPCVMPYVAADITNKICSSVSSGYSTLVAEKAYNETFPSRSTYDFVNVENNGGAPKYQFLKLTYKGKRAYKFCKSLGYDFVNHILDSSYTTVRNAIPNVNCLTFLAMAKIWCDYFCNVNLYQGNIIVQLLRAIKCGKDFSYSGYTVYTASTGEVNPSAITLIMLNMSVPFESNLYHDAWNTENSPIGDVSNQGTPSNSIVGPYLPSISGGSDAVGQDLNAIFLKNSNNNNLTKLTPLGLNSLVSFYKFIKRNNLFGSEAAKTAFARFGIKGEDFSSYFAHKLFESSQEIDMSAVLSNSNTVDGAKGSYLGAYAGIGLASMNFDYDYKCADYGVIFNLNWIQIVPLQLHGFDPAVLRLKPFDWFTPEYDGKAMRAIPLMEVSSGNVPTNQQQNRDTQIYGFAGIYDDYRQMRDEVLGDFVIGNAQKFVFARDISNKRDLYRFPIVPQSDSIQYYNRWGNQVDMTDPFQFDVESGDRFYLQFKWTIDASRQLLSKADSLDLEGEGDIPVSTSPTPHA